MISTFVDMNCLGLNVWQALELNFTIILLKYLGFYSSVWLQSGDKKANSYKLASINAYLFYI